MADPVTAVDRLLRDRDPDEIERAARVGSWTLDPATGEARWSAEMHRILGLAPDGPPIELGDIGRLFTPESVERVSAAVGRAVATGESWQLDLELLGPDGAPGGWVVSTGTPERDDAGLVVRIHGTMQDVTEQRRLEDQLRQAQRLEAIGQLAGGIAHDFNNILTAIRGYAELARDALDPGHPARTDVDQVVAASDRAGELVGQLLAFSRRQVLQPRVVDPADIVAEVTPLLRRLLGAQIDLQVNAASGAGRIRVDPGQLSQVILNLAVNARDAMPDGGTLTIETRAVELDEHHAATHLDSSPGPHIVIAVSDTGSGMDAATQARAFEPFFTTKEVGKGTGMGLATVYGIVRQSAGSIYLYSEPGRGSTFRIYFPRTDAASEDPGPADGLTSPAATPRSTETVLLVEDDPDVRALARRVLSGAGFVVLEADRGTTAIEVAAAHPGPIDLLLTDVVLPGGHGVELAERLRADRPDLPVLYVSGFTENAVIQRGVVAPEVRFLPKPYRAADLLSTVRSVLDGVR